MPYEIVNEGERYCVRKQGETNTMKCYDDKAEATKYLRALYANVHESIDGFAEFSMAVTKANTDANGVMRWRSVNSDIEADYYGERMSKELFKDFIAHIGNEDEIPEPFKSAICEEDWCGGMPYVSLAHYKSGAGKVNVPGEPNKIYLDGEALKSTGILYDTPLGKAVFKSLQKDLVEKRDDKIRVSIGFLDLEHSHGDKFTFTRKALGDKCPLCAKGVGDKIYKKGHLVHLALTRVPANPRTDVEVEKSMTTKLEDAKSIVEDEAVLKDLELKSLADEVLVIKSEDADADEAKDGKKKKKGDKADMPAKECADVVEESVVEPVVENSVFTPVPVTEPTPVEKSLASLVAKIDTIKSQGLTGEKALSELQPDFDHIGEVIKAEFTPAPSPADVEKENLETTLRSLFSELLPQYLAQTVAPIQSKLDALEGELRAKSLTTPKEKTIETVQRSLNPTLVQKSQDIVQKTKSQFDLIARQSVGLQ